MPPAAAQVSKKQLRKQAKAQFLAERKAAARRAASGDDAVDGGPRRQRKRRNQRKCNSGEDVYAQKENPAVQYVRCTSANCKYFRENAGCQMRTVAPYVHRFQSFVKARWCGQSLGEVFLEEFEGLSPAYCQAAIAMGLIRINDEAKQPEYVIRNGDLLEHVMHRHEPAIHLDAMEVRSLVHWNSDDVVVVNKPSSLPVHPSGAYRHNSMTFLLQRECDLPELFPVHRLDRLTSGLLMFSKSAVKARALCDEIASGGVQKHYVARVLGEFPTGPSSRGNDQVEYKAFKHIGNDALVKMSFTEQNGTAYWRMAAPIACISPLDHGERIKFACTSSIWDSRLQTIRFTDQSQLLWSRLLKRMSR
uniref:Pseudouridine synthase RsuA/RluA-like domain-containing protein n=1 Tax=Globisporangium ultimum (strain ATCC 200006 / CBS 805.95 / DAOM BR144) TaxID=431595 RepID=K3X6W2_GLOUD